MLMPESGRYMLQPDPIETSHVDAWYMDESTEDQRLPHRCCNPSDDAMRAWQLQRKNKHLYSVASFAASIWSDIEMDPCNRLEPNETVSLEHLQKLGVVYWKVDGEEDPKLQAIRDARGYSYKVRMDTLHALEIS